MASMTLSDTRNASLPPLWPSLFDLGSLFRSRPAPDAQWTWEPPSYSEPKTRTPKLREQEEPFASGYEYALSRLCSMSDIRGLYWKLCPTGESAVEFSRAALRRALELGQLSKDDGSVDALAIPLDFLESDVNVSAAGNINTFLEWTMQHFSSPHPHLKVADYLSYRIRQGTLAEDDICAALDTYRSHIGTGFSTTEFLSFLPAVRSLCKAARVWITANHELTSSHRVSTSVIDLLRELPTDRHSFVALVNHIGRLPLDLRQAYKAIVLEQVLICARLDVDSGRRFQLESALHNIMRSAPRDNGSDFTKWWLKTLVSATSYLVVLTSSGSCDANVLGHWLSVLNQSKSCEGNYQELWARLEPVLQQDEARAVIMAHISQPMQDTTALPAGTATVETPIHDLKFTPKIGSAQIHDCLAKDQVQEAMMIFKASRSVQLSSCESLLFAMVSHGWTSIGPYMQILRRGDTHASVARSGSRVNNILSAQRAKLVENLAYHISMSDVPTNREAFRMVHSLYTYLVGHHASISPIMSRALLRAGVTRFLRDSTLVPRERFNWILGIVSRVEGDTVANDLDAFAGKWIDAMDSRAKRGRTGAYASLTAKQPQRPVRIARSPRLRWARRKGVMYRLRGVASSYVSFEGEVRQMREYERADVNR